MQFSSDTDRFTVTQNFCALTRLQHDVFIRNEFEFSNGSRHRENRLEV